MPRRPLLFGILLVSLACSKPPLQFPKGFQWGVSASAQESEGQNTNSDWDAFAAIGKAPPAGWAQNSYNLYDTDNQNAQSLHLNAFQFTIEWARLVPKMPADPTAPLTAADVDPTALAHYHAVVDSAIAHGLTPVVTVTHFSLPVWVDNPAAYDAGAGAFTDGSLGGWTNPKIAEALASYGAFLAQEFGDKVKWWLTTDEPMVVLLAGYMFGNFPPGLTALNLNDPLPNGSSPVGVVKNMIAAHALTYHAMKAVRPDLQISFAQNSVIWVPIHPSDPANVAATERVDFAYNLQILDSVTQGQFDTGFVGQGPLEQHPEWANTLDYVGVNYYDTDFVANGSLFPPVNAVPCSDAVRGAVGDAIYASLGCPPKNPSEVPGMTQILLKYQARYGLPMVITENGYIDTPEGKSRRLVQELAAAHDAIAQGANVLGYFYWTLNYDYEWNDGWTQDMGLYDIAGFQDGGLGTLPDGGLGFPGPNTDFTRVPLHPFDEVMSEIAGSDGISADLLAQYGDAGG